MEVVKVCVTEQNKEAYYSKNKSKENRKVWDDILNKSRSMTAKEFWDNEWAGYESEKIKTHWFFVVGKPESIIDELINLKIGDTDVSYPYMRENRPWEINEDKMSWDDIKEHADNMADFIQKLYDYI